MPGTTFIIQSGYELSMNAVRKIMEVHIPLLEICNVNASRIPLSELLVNEHATILSFRGGRAVTSRLAGLGFTPGAEVVMTQNYGHGPLIVSVRGTHVALGRDEAAKISIQRKSA